MELGCPVRRHAKPLVTVLNEVLMLLGVPLTHERSASWIATIYRSLRQLVHYLHTIVAQPLP